MNPAIIFKKILKEVKNKPMKTEDLITITILYNLFNFTIFINNISRVLNLIQKRRRVSLQ